MRETATHVYFWGGPLSQWFRATFTARLGAQQPPLEFGCAEQYMMAAKAQLFGDRETFDEIKKSRDPRKQKALGRRVRDFDAQAWIDAVPAILLRANLAKFEQNRELSAYLIATQGKRLVEASPVDRVYGVGLHFDDPRIDDEVNWLGANLLGRQLEVVREQLVTGVADAPA